MLIPPLKALIYDNLHTSIVEQLSNLGIEVDYQPQLPAENVVKHLSGVHIIIGRTKVPITASFLSQAPDLLAIVRAGAGLDDIDVDAAAKRGIELINAPEGNAPAVGEHAAALLLNLLHKISSSQRQVLNGQWLREENRTTELGKLTVGIIGFGHNGSAFAKCISGFGGKILVYDKYKTGFGTEQFIETSLAQIQAEADVISLHVPLTDETKYLIDNQFINSVNKPFYLLNVCRGGVVNTADLVEGLKIKKVLGAGLDVLEIEPPHKGNDSFRQLFFVLSGLDNVTITPHIAGLSNESYHRINTVIVQKLSELLPSIHKKLKIKL